MLFHKLHKGINTGDDAATLCKTFTDAVTPGITFFLFVYLRVVIGRKSAYDLHSSRWHFETRWTIEMSLDDSLPVHLI